MKAVTATVLAIPTYVVETPNGNALIGPFKALEDAQEYIRVNGGVGTIRPVYPK